ncbi:PH domain-containing protein [Aquipuribacter nitratireducens]|uniref:PH domain-containing protein n=1 Tax=Aquipuribacter nitratireducens TaxID=650104 RepID=A0ABW0GRH2_9MICO
MSEPADHGSPELAAASRQLGATDWRRLHPVTPLVKGWAALLIGLAIVLEGVVGGPMPGPELEFLGNLGVQVGAVFAVAVLVVLGNVVGWAVARYRIDAEAVHLHTGVLNRNQRQARLDRLQAVDVVQPLVGRLVGLAEVRIEVAGGADSQVRLQYLKESEAQRLRNALLAAAAGVDYETEDAPEAPETPVLQVPLGRLVGGSVLTGTTIALLVLAIAAGVGLLVAALVPAVPLSAVLAPFAAGPGALIALVVTSANQFAKSFAFRVAVSPDGLRVRSGLTETRAATVPPGRVQAVKVSQSWLWRPFDWWHVKVNIAGYGADAQSQSTSAVLLPVGRRDDVRALLGLVTPGLDTGDWSVVRHGLDGSGPDGGYTTVPRRARWLDLLAWRRIGYAVTEDVLLARSGLLNRELVAVPHARTQSLGLTQGPLQRRLGVVTFALHSTPGPVSPTVPHLSEAEGQRVLWEQGARARAARAAAGPERWMRRAGAATPSAAGVGLPPHDEPVGVREGDGAVVERGEEGVELDRRGPDDRT